MKGQLAILPEAISAIQNSRFQEAFDLADKEANKDPENFWAWYIAAVSLGFLKKTTTFEHYVAKTASINPDSVFVHYLKAYSSLLHEDIESALIVWTGLLDKEEGWLARELIEKARKSNTLMERARKGDISYFVVLPRFPELEKPRVNEIKPPVNDVKSQSQTQNKKGSGSFSKSLIRNLFFIGLAGFLGVVIYSQVSQYIINNKPDNSSAWKNLKIDDWAALVNQQTKNPEQYVYKDKDKLIEDFENAKKMLSSKKINQSRFLLQRIINSNADFKTKEKSRIFLGFIPQPDYQEFSDPLMPDKILEGPSYYTDCLVLWQGNVINLKEVERGKEIRLLVKNNNEDFIVDGFLPTNEKKSNWLPFSDFRKNQELQDRKKQAIVYGKFKGLVGKQKNIYLELIQLWM